MEMTAQELWDRTKASAKRALGLVEALPGTRSGNLVAAQFGRSGTPEGVKRRAYAQIESLKSKGENLHAAD